MKKPKMIIFDYGQTLVNESIFDGLAGEKALLSKAITNGSNASPSDIQQFIDELEDDIGRFDPKRMELYRYEIHNFKFQRYVYEYFDITFDLEQWEMEKIFWDNASPAKPTDGIEELLKYLQENQIRSGAISNISFGEQALKKRIEELIPNNNFEFIIATSEYVFRKPSKYIFQLALKKAGLTAEDVWYCGDNPVCDVDGPSEMGMTGIWYTGAARNTDKRPKNDFIHMKDWKEMISLLQTLY